jgi:hypothetical protein
MCEDPPPRLEGFDSGRVDLHPRAHLAVGYPRA